MHPPDERHLHLVLTDEADRHQPDREAMLRRIGQGRRSVAPAQHVRARMLRPAVAAFAVVLLLVLGIAGVRLFAPEPPAPDLPVAAPTITIPTKTTPTRTTEAPAPRPTTPPVVAAPGATTTRPHPPTKTTAVPPSSAPAGGTAPPVRDGFLAATGALDPHSITDWAQNNLTLTTTETLTTLKVTVRVVHTDGVADAGHWTSIPAELLTTTVEEDDHELVYRFALKDDVTLAPGRYTFAAQYHHAAGARAVTGDSYLAAGRGVSKTKSEVSGAFTGE